MSARPGQPDRSDALIETSNQLGIDRTIVANLRYREYDLGRYGGHDAIVVHGRGPSVWAVRRLRFSAPPTPTTNSSPPWTRLRLGGGFCLKKAWSAATWLESVFFRSLYCFEVEESSSTEVFAMGTTRLNTLSTYSSEGAVAVLSSPPLSR